MAWSTHRSDDRRPWCLTKYRSFKRFIRIYAIPRELHLVRTWSSFLQSCFVLMFSLIEWIGSLRQKGYRNPPDWWWILTSQVTSTSYFGTEFQRAVYDWSFRRSRDTLRKMLYVWRDHFTWEVSFIRLIGRSRWARFVWFLWPLDFNCVFSLSREKTKNKQSIGDQVQRRRSLRDI